MDRASGPRTTRRRSNGQTSTGSKKRNNRERNLFPRSTRLFLFREKTRRTSAQQTTVEEARTRATGAVGDRGRKQRSRMTRTPTATKFNFNFPVFLSQPLLSYLLGQVVRRGDERPLLDTDDGTPLHSSVGASCSRGTTHGGLERGACVSVIHGCCWGRIT